MVLHSSSLALLLGTSAMMMTMQPAAAAVPNNEGISVDELKNDVRNLFWLNAAAPGFDVCYKKNYGWPVRNIRKLEMMVPSAAKGNPMMVLYSSVLPPSSTQGCVQVIANTASPSQVFATTAATSYFRITELDDYSGDTTVVLESPKFAVPSATMNYGPLKVVGNTLVLTVNVTVSSKEFFSATNDVVQVYRADGGANKVCYLATGTNRGAAVESPSKTNSLSCSFVFTKGTAGQTPSVITFNAGTRANSLILYRPTTAEKAAWAALGM